MEKNKSVKKTLLVSLMTILACAALIAGTTFAWFTDSVSSGTNIIQSGNLQISATVHELDENGTIEYLAQYDFMQEQAQTFKFAETGADFKGNSKFMSAEAFAPNQKFVKLIRVHNAGSLAAKVKLYFSVQDNGLQNALWFAAASRDGAITVNRAPMANITETMNAKEFEVQPGQDTDIVLAYGMDAGAGSEYENKSVSIACTIIAAQVDEEASYPVVPNRIETELTQNVEASSGAVLADNNVSITIPENALASDTEVTFSVKTETATDSSVTYDISLKAENDSPLALNVPVSVELNIGKNLKNVNVKHSGEPMAEEDYSYNAVTGILTICTSSFSPFEVSFEANHAVRVNNSYYFTLNDAVENAKNGDTLVLLRDITGFTTEDIVEIPAGKTLTLDMNGKSIVTDSSFQGRPIKNLGNLTVTGDGVIDSSAAAFEDGGYGAIRNDEGGTLIIENGTFIGSVLGNGSAIRNGAGSSCTIYGGDFTGTSAVYNQGDMTIENGNFYSASCNSCSKAAGFEGVWAYAVQNRFGGSLVFNNGTVTGVQGGLSINGGTGVVNGGTFQTVACEVHGDSTAHYALYITGGDSFTTATVNGGTYTSASKTAVYIGNDTLGDGGAVLGAKATINDGKFSSKAGVNVMYVGTVNTEAELKGGEYTNNQVVNGKEKKTLDDYTAERYSVVAYSATRYVVEPWVGIVKYPDASGSTKLKDGRVFYLTQDVENETKTQGYVLYFNYADTTLDLNGYSLTAPTKKNSGSVAAITVGGSKDIVKLTINGTENSVVNGFSGAAMNNAVHVKEGATVVINGGTYTAGTAADGSACSVIRAGETIVNADGSVKSQTAGHVIINGGTFYSDYSYNGIYWLLNCQDGTGSTITVTGGTFRDFDPSNPQTENPNESFVAEGYTVVSEIRDGHTWYTVIKAQ